MIKENRVARITDERRRAGNEENKRTKSRPFPRSVPISMQEIQPFFLPQLSFFFFSSFFYHGPTFPWALTSLRGRKAVLRTSLSALYYIQEGITALTSSVPSS